MSSTPSVLIEAPVVTELWQVPTDALGGLLDAALRGVDRLQSLSSAVVAEAVSRGVVDPSGESGPRPRDWVRAQSSVSVGETEIRRILRRVTTRSALPAVTALHDAGAVSTAFLDAAATGIHRLPADVRESLDVTLSGMHGSVTPRSFRRSSIICG